MPYLFLSDRTRGLVCQQRVAVKRRIGGYQEYAHMQSHSGLSAWPRHKQTEWVYRVDIRHRTVLPISTSCAYGWASLDLITWNIWPGWSLDAWLLPIQLATSSMFGTVADTRRNLTSDPLAFIRETTTSRVLPRDSLRMWTWTTLEYFLKKQWQQQTHLVHKKKFDLR